MPLKCDAVMDKIKARVAAADPDPSKRTVLAVFQFNVTDGGAQVKQWTLDLKVLEVYEGPCKGTADVIVTVDDSAIAQVLSKELSLEDAKAQGKLKVEGDLEVAKKLSELTKKLLSGA